MTVWRRLATWVWCCWVLFALACSSQPPPAPPSSVVLLPAGGTYVSSPYPDSQVLRESRSIGSMAAAAEDSASDDEPVDHSWADEQVPDTDPSALVDFEEDLEPYGEWFEDPYYGTVWVPYEQAVGTQFVPYLSAGRWALTEGDQWIWVSNYPFGAIVFHYGRWVQTRDYGWVWIPGRRYAPAWVTFRVSDEPYVGWAPMPPRYVWRSGRAVMLSSVPPPVFVFVPYRYAFYPSVHSYAIYHPWHVRHWMMHSWVYWPTGALYGYYYCPPVRYIPPRARPSGRRAPEPLAAQRVRYREPATALAEIDDRNGPGVRSATRRTTDLVRPPKVAPRSKTRRLDSRRVPQLEGRPSIARTPQRSASSAASRRLSTRDSTVTSKAAPSRGAEDALRSKRAAAHGAVRSFEQSPGNATRTQIETRHRSFKAKRDARERRTVPRSDSGSNQRRSVSAKRRAAQGQSSRSLPRQPRVVAPKPRLPDKAKRSSRVEERNAATSRPNPTPKARPSRDNRATAPKKAPSLKPRANPKRPAPRAVKELRRSVQRPTQLRPNKKR